MAALEYHSHSKLGLINKESRKKLDVVIGNILKIICKNALKYKRVAILGANLREAFSEMGIVLLFKRNRKLTILSNTTIISLSSTILIIIMVLIIMILIADEGSVYNENVLYYIAIGIIWISNIIKLVIVSFGKYTVWVNNKY